MFDIVQQAIPIVCVLAVVLGIASTGLRPAALGIAFALLAPTLLCYVLAWIMMSPVFQQHVTDQAGWARAATMFWTAWATPASLVAYVLKRRTLSRGRGNLS
jgi:hypothetical protein